MTCRAPTSTTTCAGSTPNGAQPSYDSEGRLSSWQDTLGGTSDQFLYDGAGQRVAQQVSSGGIMTTTTYVGQVEDLRTTGGTTTTTTYYYAGGKRVALAVNGTFSYLGVDGLGSASVALDGSGSVQASVLYGPYGAVRYSSGTMPGSYGYTGQRTDATTGLDYYNARYYDASAGQFASADTVADGLNRYGYVGGNPTTLSDPSGHKVCNPENPDDCIVPGGGGGGGGCTHNCGNPPPPGDGGGKKQSCRIDREQVGCKAWRLWEEGSTYRCAASEAGAPNNSAECIRERTLDALRQSTRGIIYAAAIVDLASFAVAFLGKVAILAVLSGAIALLEALGELFGMLSNISAADAEQVLPYAATVAGLLAEVTGFFGIVSGLAAWALWTIQGTYAVVMFGLEGFVGAAIRTLSFVAGTLLLDAAASVLTAIALNKLADAASQANMPIWDWCGSNGPGAGQCPAEPNGGMPYSNDQ